MNHAVNIFWTILGFTPVIGFWAAADSMRLCYMFIGISILSVLLPGRYLQISNNPKFYTRLGVKWIRRFVQNGDVLNRSERKNNPQHKVIKGRSNALGYMHTVVIYERYHCMCILFFLLTTVYSIIKAQYPFTLIIIIANIIYNICPLLLQQYNRARIARLIR